MADANDTSLKSGIYGVNADHHPSGAPCSYGCLIVFNGRDTAQGGDPVVQIAVGNGCAIWVRMKWHIFNWTDWRPI